MATFGYDGAADGAENYSTDRKAGTIFTLTEQGSTTKISARAGNWSYAVKAKGVIYGVTDGEPNGLELVTAETEIPEGSPDAWKEFTGGDLPAVLPAGDYWIGIIAETAAANWVFRRDGESGFNIKQNVDDYTDGPSDPFGTVTTFSDKRHCVYATYTPGGGQLHEIFKDAIVKASAIDSQECTFNIAKNAAVSSQVIHAPETTFNIPKDAITKALADVSIEVISGIIEIFKDAVATAQATFALESTFNVEKDAITEALATVGVETIFNIVKDAINKASATPQILGIYPINKDASVEASAVAALQQTLNINKDAVVVSVSTPLIQSTFNISPEAVVKVLAEVTVIKEGEALKVTKLFLLLGNIAIQLTGD